MGKMTKVALIGAFGMVIGITALQQIGSNLEEEFAAQAAVEPTSKVAVAEAAPVVAEVTETATTQPTEQAGSTMLEQAILDAFSSSSGSKRNASNAKDFVEASINAQGYLCADAVEMRQAAPGQYGIGCVMNRDGTGAAIYLVDSRTGSVTPIS